MKKLGMFLFALLCCSGIFASTIKEIVVLGDSLSDNGRLYESLKIVPKSPPYYKGRFSNGPTWAEGVGNFFYDQSYIDTKIYAWGGATAILHNPLHDSFLAPIVLETELNLYLMNSLFTDKSKVLYIIWIGANDYLYDRQDNINALTDSVVNKITWAVTTLMGYGAQNLLVMNLPDLAKTPYAQQHNLASRFDKLTRLHNQKLLAEMDRLRSAHPDRKILSYDVYSAFNDLINNKEKYNRLFNLNLENTTEACWKGSVMQQSMVTINDDLQSALMKKNQNKNFDTQAMSAFIANSPSLALAYSMGKAQSKGLQPCTNAKQYIFWDDLHPTAVVHMILASLVETALVESGVV